VKHGLVVSVLGCCTAAPGAIPARHPSLDPAGRKLFAQMQESFTQLRKKVYQQENIPRKNNVCIVSYQKLQNNKKSAGHGTNI
jgi:hypothetical protein